MSAKLQQLTTTEEIPSCDDSEDDDDDTQSADDQNDSGTCRRPTPSRQRRLVARCESLTDGGGGSHTYAVAKVWYRRWEEHVGATRGFVAGSSPVPGPVDMDTQNDDGNSFVNENVWKLLAGWYGVAATHHLDRKHLYFKDEKVRVLCFSYRAPCNTLSPVSTRWN